MKSSRAAVKLTALEGEPLSVPTVDPFVISSGQVHATRSVLVRVRLERSRASAEGLGEGACLPPVTKEDQPDAVAAVQRASLSGQKFRTLGELGALLDGALGATPVARAAAEVAILDAWARLDRSPLYRWLGGSSRPPTLVTDITVPILPAARMVELALRWRALGFTAFKVKVGRSIDDDLAVLEQLAAALPGATFRPDANGALTVAEAVRYAKAAQRLGARLECFEQPCATLTELAEVATALEVPVLADESVKSLADLEAALGARAIDGVNLKLAKSGGVLEALRIGRAAHAGAMPVMVGGMLETRLGMTAASHLAAALGGVAFCDLDTAWLLARDPFRGGYRDDGPRYTLTDAPGLGVSAARGRTPTPR